MCLFVLDYSLLVGTPGQGRLLYLNGLWIDKREFCARYTDFGPAAVFCGPFLHDVSVEGIVLLCGRVILILFDALGELYIFFLYSKPTFRILTDLPL